MNLVIDVGNSSIHCGLFHPGHDSPDKFFRIATRSVDLKETIEIAVRESGIDLEKVEKAMYVSVVKEAEKELERSWAELSKVRLNKVKYRMFNMLNIDYDDPGKLGLDRLVNALPFIKAKTPVIVADLGTATTIDAVDKGTFLGGMILPGVLTGLRALTERASALELGELEPGRFLLEKNSSDCIRSGVINLNASGISGIIGRISRETFPEQAVKVVITGGQYRLIEGNLTVPYDYDGELTLKGLNILLSNLPA